MKVDNVPRTIDEEAQGELRGVDGLKPSEEGSERRNWWQDPRGVAGAGGAGGYRRLLERGTHVGLIDLASKCGAGSGSR